MVCRLFQVDKIIMEVPEPELTEEMAQQWLEKMGLLSVVENEDEFEEFQKQLRKLKGSGTGYKKYDVGKRENMFSMTRLPDNEQTHFWSDVDATITLFGKGGNAQFGLEVKHNIPGIPAVSLIAPASWCTVKNGEIEGSQNKAIIFTMPVKLADGVKFNVEVRWRLSPDEFVRFMKVNGTWLANHKSGASVRQQKKALEMMRGPKTGVSHGPHPSDKKDKDV